MVRNRFRIIIHLILTIIWCSSLYYDIYHLPRLGNATWAAKLVMLTNINFVLFVAYSVLSSLQLVSGSKWIKKVVDFCFYTSVFPVGMTTVALFWGLYAIEPELVMPAWIAALIPRWLNHITHTLPGIHLIIDIICNHRVPPKGSTLKIMAFILVAIYFKIIFYVRYMDGYWLYPVLELLHPFMHIIAYLGAVLGYFSLCRLATLTTSLLHRDSKRAKVN